MNKEISVELLKLILKKDMDTPVQTTIADVLMVLYNKHGIWIWVERCSTAFRPYAEEIGNKRFGKWEGFKYASLIEAYEQAILHTLNNLL